MSALTYVEEMKRNRDRERRQLLDSSSQQNETEEKCNCLCLCDDDIGDYSLSSQDYTRWLNPPLL